MCCGLVAVEVMCTTEALGILKLFSPSSATVVTCNKPNMTNTITSSSELFHFEARSNEISKRFFLINHHLFFPSFYIRVYSGT